MTLSRALPLLLSCLACAAVPAAPPEPVEVPAEAPSSWARALGGVNREYANGIAARPDGGLWIAGHYTGGSEIGNLPLRGAGQTDAFVAGLGADGSVVRALRLAGPGADEAKAVAVGSTGEAYVVGLFSARADFDPGPGKAELESAGSGDAFVVRIEADGRFGWVRGFGGALGDVAHAVAVGSDGTVYVAGYFQGRAGFVGGEASGDLPAAQSSAGGTDAFVAAFDGTGRPLWARRFGGPGDDEARAVAVGDDGILVAGRFTGTASTGEGEGARTATSAGGTDAFVLRLGVDGRPLHLVRFGGEEDDVAHAAAVSGGKGWTAGQIAGVARAEPRSGSEAGRDVVAREGRTDGFVLEIEPGGAAGRVHTFGGPGDDFPFGLAPAPDGGLYVAGFSQDVPDPEALRGPGPTASFVIRLGADLAESWRRSFTATEGIQVLGVAAAGTAGPRVAGIFLGEAELELGAESPTAISARKKVDAFAAALER